MQREARKGAKSSEHRVATRAPKTSNAPQFVSRRAIDPIVDTGPYFHRYARVKPCPLGWLWPWGRLRFLTLTYFGPDLMDWAIGIACAREDTPDGMIVKAAANPRGMQGYAVGR